MRNAAVREITLPELSGGLNTHDPESAIADNQSPDMLNLWYKDMALSKRPGQKLLVKLADVKRISDPYNGYCVVHAGTKLYRWDVERARNDRGVLDMPQGYPQFYEAGDYFTINRAGTLDGVAWQAGDCAIYSTSPAGQMEAATVRTVSDGGITTAGTARVTVTDLEMGSPLVFNVSVLQHEKAVAIAEKICAAFAGNVTLSAKYTAYAEGNKVSLRRKDVLAKKDNTLNIAIANGTCEGLADAPQSEDAPFWYNAVAEIKSGIADAPGTFVEFGDTLYYMDGAEIWEITPEFGVAPIEPYAPVVMMNARPDLSESDDGEAYNLIGGGFTVKYNGNGTSATYKLPQTGLDSTAVKITAGIASAPYTKELTQGTHFTVDQAAGTVNFAGGSSPHGAPMIGTNNVVITAYKTTAGNREKIAGCKVAVRFGGEAAGVVGGTRVFVMGNPAYPYHYWRSDLGMHVSAGMRYFPDMSEEVLDQNSEPITAAAKMSSQLVIFKENSIFAVGYSFDGKDVYYPVRECNSAIGCDMPGSVQLIDNNLVFAHSRSGVHILAGTNTELENIVKPLSANINNLLLRESGLKNACSFDHDRYYWLCVNGRVYLWDYDTTPYYNYADYDKAQKRLAWYRFDAIHAHVFFARERLYCGGANGIVQFTPSRNDFGKAFAAYFKSKAFDLGSPEELKTFVALYPSFATDGNIYVIVSVGNEKTDTYMQRKYDMRSFDWRNFSWAAFAWSRIKFTQTQVMRLNMRKAAYLQVKVSGDALDRGVGLSGLRVTYYTNRKMKG